MVKIHNISFVIVMTEFVDIYRNDSVKFVMDGIPAYVLTCRKCVAPCTAPDVFASLQEYQ